MNIYLKVHTVLSFSFLSHCNWLQESQIILNLHQFWRKALPIVHHSWFFSSSIIQAIVRRKAQDWQELLSWHNLRTPFAPSPWCLSKKRLQTNYWPVWQASWISAWSSSCRFLSDLQKQALVPPWSEPIPHKALLSCNKSNSWHSLTIWHKSYLKATNSPNWRYELRGSDQALDWGRSLAWTLKLEASHPAWSCSGIRASFKCYWIRKW